MVRDIQRIRILNLRGNTFKEPPPLMLIISNQCIKNAQSSIKCERTDRLIG